MTTITISGQPGSGKTTVSELLVKKLGLKYIYSGDIFRKMAKEFNMSLEEFGEYCENNKEVDEQLDNNQLKELHKGNVIVEGRISGWLAHRHKIPSLKIFLHADLDTRISRVVNRESGELKKRKKQILNREKSEKNRYKNYYDIDIDDTSIYDLVINTSEKTPEEIVNIILKKLKE